MQENTDVRPGKGIYINFLLLPNKLFQKKKMVT
jgi:hypothetical protein